MTFDSGVIVAIGIQAIGLLISHVKLGKDVEKFKEFIVDHDKLHTNTKVAVDREIGNLNEKINDHRVADDKEFAKMTAHIVKFYEEFQEVKVVRATQEGINHRLEEVFKEIKGDIAIVKSILNEMRDKG